MQQRITGVRYGLSVTTQAHGRQHAPSKIDDTMASERSHADVHLAPTQGSVVCWTEHVIANATKMVSNTISGIKM